MRLLTIPEISERLQDRRLELVAIATGFTLQHRTLYKAGNAKSANEHCQLLKNYRRIY
jgi:hypothetical protein